MNRADLQQLSELRLQESKGLLAAGFPEGACYLAGYSVECALKACIARRTQQFDFPEKGWQKYLIHDLRALLGYAGLKLDLEKSLLVNPPLSTSWNIVQTWSEESRYARGRTMREAEELLSAIEDQMGGLLPWLQQRW